jgi:hypothetical protein
LHLPCEVQGLRRGFWANKMPFSPFLAFGRPLWPFFSTRPRGPANGLPGFPFGFSGRWRAFSKGTAFIRKFIIIIVLLLGSAVDRGHTHGHTHERTATRVCALRRCLPRACTRVQCVRIVFPTQVMYFVTRSRSPRRPRASPERTDAPRARSIQAVQKGYHRVPVTSTKEDHVRRLADQGALGASTAERLWCRSARLGAW